jgi:hypothetical protein
VQARRRRLAVAAIFAVGLCACGHSGGTHAAGGSPAASASSAGQCARSADTVTAVYPVAQMEVQGSSSWRTIPPQTTTAPCGTDLIVTSSGGTVQIQFGSQGSCKFMQDSEEPGTATLTTRLPRGALFNQGAGSTWCTITGVHWQIKICGLATLEPHGPYPQYEGSCNTSDPDLRVAVWSGSVTLIDRYGSPHIVNADRELSYDFARSNWRQPTQADFSAADIETFDEQALAMGIEITRAPQTVKIVSVPPPSPTPGQTYTVIATGGGSGNPVQLTIDPKSAKYCSAATTSARSAIVTFIAPGLCVIDANQQGNNQYLQAPPVHQTVMVGPATPS